MSDPVPAQPATIDYAGPGAALGRPVEHRGMYLPSPPQGLGWRPVAQAVLGAFVAAGAIAQMGWLSDEVFSKHSPARLAQPILPIVGMVLIHVAAARLSRRPRRRALCAGLWMGGFVALGLFGVQLIGSGYLRWFTGP